MNDMLRVDLFTEIVDLLPPAFLYRRGKIHCVMVQFDDHWLVKQPEDFGRIHFEITFYLSEDHREWEFQITHGGPRYPVDLIVDTILRLPTLASVETEFVNMHIEERVTAVCPDFAEDEMMVPLHHAMFYKEYFDNPNGGRAKLNWAIRLGKKEIDG